MLCQKEIFEQLKLLDKLKEEVKERLTFRDKHGYRFCEAILNGDKVEIALVTNHSLVSFETVERLYFWMKELQPNKERENCNETTNC